MINPKLHLVLIIASVQLITSCTWSDSGLSGTRSEQADTLAETAVALDSVKYAIDIPVDSYNIVTGRVKKNQFIAAILASYGVPWNTVEQLLRENREVFDPRRVRQAAVTRSS